LQSWYYVPFLSIPGAQTDEIPTLHLFPYDLLAAGEADTQFLHICQAANKPTELYLHTYFTTKN